MNLNNSSNNNGLGSGFVTGGNGSASGFVTDGGRDGSGFITDNAREGSGFVTDGGRDGSGFITENAREGSGFISGASNNNGSRQEYTDTLLSTNGAMSDVYVRYYHKLEFREILKRIKSQYAGDATYRKLFLQEYTNMKSLNHENIVKAKRQGEDSQGLWYSMEYVDGKPLTEIISNNIITDTDGKIEILRQILSALSYVHKTGLIHRDLKPDNIMVANRNHNVKIIDFGLAISDSFGTRLKMAGTDRYMSPEQRVNSADIDQQSDIYAFGLIMAEFLTGVFPQNGDTSNIDIIQYRNVVDKCLKTNPKERYSNCDEILFDLRKRYNAIPDDVRNIIHEIVEDGEVTMAEKSRLNSLIRLHNLDANAVFALMEYELEKVREARRKALFRKLAVIIPLILLIGGLAAWWYLGKGTPKPHPDDRTAIVEPVPKPKEKEENPPKPDNQQETQPVVDQPEENPPAPFYDLGYGRWYGKLDQNGNPNGHGKMEYSSDHQLNKYDLQKRQAHPGDVVEGDFKNGDFVQGTVNGRFEIIGG